MLVPDILAHAGNERQSDGLHPILEGARQFARTVADMLAAHVDLER